MNGLELMARIKIWFYGQFFLFFDQDRTPVFVEGINFQVVSIDDNEWQLFFGVVVQFCSAITQFKHNLPRSILQTMFT